MLWANGSKVLKQKVVGWFPRGDTFCPELTRYLDVGSIAVGMFLGARNKRWTQIVQEVLAQLPGVIQVVSTEVVQQLAAQLP